MKVHKILAIDDDEAFVSFVKLNLEKDGSYEVRTETDSTKALAVAAEFEPDAVLLDIIMPEMDGGKVAELFLEHPKLKSVPIIMLTALMTLEETKEGYTMSPTGYALPKPVDLDTLKSCLEKVIFECSDEPKNMDTRESRNH